MKVVVVGGAGLVGSKVVELLTRDGHEVLSASRRTGVDVISGEGLAQAFEGAKVVIDAVNSPSFEDEVALPFFETSTRNILAAGAAAGVHHHVALSIVGAERLITNGYFRAKLKQENLVSSGSVPFTILRATQFFEFFDRIIRSGADGDVVRLAPARVQPVAAHDAAAALADIAGFRAVNDTLELAGPDSFKLSQIGEIFMTLMRDTRQVIADPEALYFGTRLSNETLVAGNPRFGHTDFDMWARRLIARQAVSAEY